MQMPCEQCVCVSECHVDIYAPNMCVCVRVCVNAFKAPIRGDSSARMSEAGCNSILTKHKRFVCRGQFKCPILFVVAVFRAAVSFICSHVQRERERGKRGERERERLPVFSCDVACH